MRARIAIVEDEPDLRDAVAEYLGANGYDVIDGRQTPPRCARWPTTESFHLAILDIAMPGEDGLSLGRWLRSQMPIGIIYRHRRRHLARPHRRAGARRRRLYGQALRAARIAGAGAQRAAPRAAAGRAAAGARRQAEARRAASSPSAASRPISTAAR